MKKNVIKRLVLGLMAAVMCFGLFACTKNLTGDQIKAKLEKKDYKVIVTTMAGRAGIMGTKDSESITIFVCASEEDAKKLKTTLDISDKIVLNQEKQYVFFGTEAGVKVFKGII